ncbi:MAG: carbon-nitrogen hydrolase family protein [Gammaproteobacteria bacterium]|nr:MAG: carbon-nitrogen hydrolase family protein [Gammaproteobacteria bacterium]
MIRIAIAQHAPRVLQREETLALAGELIAEAAAQGARLVIFPEAFVPGYPAWVWRLRPGSDWDLCAQLHGRLSEQAVDIPAGDLAPVLAAAERHAVSVVLGFNERDGEAGRSTLYNSVVLIGPDGQLQNHHRKLMPTNPERTVWGPGDAAGLRVLETPAGRLGTLLCWENYMPLARYALYAQGMDLLVAPTYDSGSDWLGTLGHIAREGGCWVVSAGVALRRDDLPEDMPGRNHLYPEGEDWINPGDSAVIAPGGACIAGPMTREQGLLLADIEPERAREARRCFDVAGHYARPELLSLSVDRQRHKPVEFH